MIHHRGFCHDVEALHYKVVALCAVLWLTTFGPCTMTGTGTQNLTGYDEYGSYKSGSSSGSEDVLVQVQVQSSVPNLNLENICRRSDLFCFPSTLSGFFADFRSTEAANVSGFSGVKRDDTVVVGTTQPNRANFQLMNGSIVSCSLESKESVRDSDDENDTSSVIRIKSNRVNDFSSQSVQISHPLLDWGRKYLHFPSLAYLTVENRHKSSVLNVFEPYCTNTQFYPCNYTEIKIRPGETASLCFVFLPKQLGLSSGHLILQTSSGGFLVRAQGFAVQPPYMLQSSIGSGSSPWVISLSNPSNEVLHLKEVSAKMSISSGNVSYVVDGVCSMIDRAGSVEYSAKEWVDVKVGQLGQLGMAIRPQKTWTVGSNSNEPILEVEFPYHSQTNVYGSFCVELLTNASRDNVDTIVFEAEYGGKSKSNDLETRLSISLDVLMPCDVNGTTVASLLVENDGPDLLSVVKISTVGENIESLQSKYVEGLILFPHTVTQVAMVTYTPNLHTNLDCKLVVHTNKSKDPELDIPCSHFAGLCSRSHSYAESRSRNVHVYQPSELKASKAKETVESDESVLGNWRSQGTKNGISVLDDREVIFPVVLIGSHHSKWIKVVNPSDKPVAMQLLLNSGEIINECRESDEYLQTSSSYTLVLNSETAPSRYGFSIPHNALTEAYVHPHGQTVLGPVVFHPSSRCVWKSSALVRNNLSGVEWLSLRGSGGLVSLILHDGSDPVHTIELTHNYGQPYMKVFYAKNTGDLPVKVDKITISGTKCELDGFVVGSCKGFALQPGESRKIIVSYHAETCVETVLRDLELGMVGGILVVPVKVSLPKLTLTTCKRSFFWIKFKKVVLTALVSVLLIFMACSYMFSVIIRDGNLSETHSSDVCLKPDTINKVVVSSLSLSLSSPEASDLELKSTAVESPKPENLTVKTGKDKARRRKKKRSSGTGLTGYLDGLSSHSSNSTPSSPLSPVKCSTPKRSPELSPSQYVRARSPFSNGGSSTVVPVKEKPSTPPKTPTPFERAPGAERKAVKPEEKPGYNIWDYHLQLCDLGLFEVGSVMLPTIAKDNLVSFFEISPQELFTISGADTVSCKQND
ncbi:putative transmembrane protein [Helianthus anomalus]